MAGQFFQKIFNKDPYEFKSIAEIDGFVKKNRKELKLMPVDTNLCSSRGSIFFVKKIDAGKRMDKLIKKIQ